MQWAFRRSTTQQINVTSSGVNDCIFEYITCVGDVVFDLSILSNDDSLTEVVFEFGII